MTQKKDTTTDTTKTPAADIPTDKSKGSKIIIWLLLGAAVVTVAAWWQTQQAPSQVEPEQTATKKLAATETAPYKPNSAAMKPQEIIVGDTDKDDFSLAELMERQDRAKRIRLALREDITTLEEKFAFLEERINTLNQQIDDMNNRPVAAPATIQVDTQVTAQMQSQLTELESKVSNLQDTYKVSTQRYTAHMQLAQHLDRIAVKVRNGESYAEEMKAFQADAKNTVLNDNLINILTNNAEKGVPSLAALIDDFNQSMQLALPVSLASKQNPSVADEIRGRLSHIVSIRRVDVDTADDSDEAQLARAEDELQMGNVDVALTHLNLLSEQPRAAFGPWRHEAEAYLQVHDAVTQLKNALLHTRAE